MTQPLTPEHPLFAVLDEERRALARIQVHLATLDLKGSKRGDYDSQLLELRDQAAEARMEDLPAIIDLMLQAQAVRSQRGLSASLPVSPQNPYFARLRLEEKGKTREVFIGKRSYINAAEGISIVDWRNAPVSRIYYRYDEGDPYEEEFGEKMVEGTLLMRRTISIADGKLTRIRTLDGTLLCNNAGEWFVLEGAAAPELRGGVGKATRVPKHEAHQQTFQQRQRGQLGLGGEGALREDKRLPEIAALIDRPQFDLITRQDAGVVVLQGGAGSGKTTVALHRVAFLHFSNPERFRQRQMRVIVSQRGLVNYISKVLPSLDVGNTPVVTMEDFQLRLRQQLLPRFKRKRLDYCPDNVSRLKKHPAMLNLLSEHVARRMTELRADLIKMTTGLRGGEQAAGKWDTGGKSVVGKIITIQRWLSGGASQPVQDRLHPWVKGLLEDFREESIHDLQEVLTDRTLLRAVFDQHAPGQVTDGQIGSLVEWVDKQASEPDDLSGIDMDRRSPIDNYSHDETDPTHALDPHDDALLIRYHQLTHGGLVPPGGNLMEYDHVAVDEAQDLSAIDIQILADATRNQSLTLAGDTQQRLVFDNHFDSWTDLLTQLQIPTLKVSTLKVAYRSTKEVVEFARNVLGPLADPDAPEAPRTGAPVEGFVFGELGEEVGFLADVLRGLMGRERSANLALITRYSAQADQYYDALSKAEVPLLRRVSKQDFTFTPGIDITDVTQIKGLEYDYVILAGVDEPSYPDSLESRHLLHIGATRAAHQLWLTASRGSSPLVPKGFFVRG